MPRAARAVVAGMIDHVLNRGNGRADLFHKPGDFDAFLRVLAEGVRRYPVDVLAYRVMTRTTGTSCCGRARTRRRWGGRWGGSA